MTLKQFCAVSVLVHIAAIYVISLIPAPEIKKSREFVTNLVSPEVLAKPVIIPKPQPKISPGIVQKRVPPAGIAPTRRTSPRQSRLQPAPDLSGRPLVPGEGAGKGARLPDANTRLGAGQVGDGAGSAGDEDSGSRKGQRLVPSDKPGYLNSRRIFDQGTIEEIAKKGTEGKSKGDNGITFETSEYKYAGYMRRLKDKIESIWIYPAEAQERGIYGDLKIQFTIKKDGMLGEVRVVRTSGYQMLDEAALKALKDGEPYWPLPAEWGMDSYKILGHFIYSKYGYQRVR